MVKIQTAMMGETEVDDEHIVHFPEGLLGLPEHTRFAMLYSTETVPFYHLQSLQDRHICFLTVDPFSFFEDYEFDFSDSTADALAIRSEKDVWVHNIVVVANDFKQSTVNLQAPLIINPRERLGRQIILNDPHYAIKHPLFAANAKSSLSGVR